MGCRRVLFASGLLVLAAGVLVLAALAPGVYASIRLATRGETATGSVVDVHYVRSGAHGNGYPIVSFRTAAGETWRFTSRMAGHSAARLGDEVRVLYDPDLPARAEIDSFATLWGPYLVTLGFVLATFVPLGSLLVWMTRFGASKDDTPRPRARFVPRWFPP